jgi:FlaA1/EpsC-like NDP-sugar epimerase
VNPATALGATKAMAEWIVQAYGQRYTDTVFSCVRFGNVLGSSGSVVHLFRKQIEQGGPVTVTDPEMCRYFMTIPEAVQLIIRAGNLGHGGEVFVLEMGDPVSIMDLAANMIRLSGQEPEKDVKIEIVGPRSGEKLREELFNENERPEPTDAERILMAVRPSLDPEWVEAVFDQVERLVSEGDEAFLAHRIAELVKQPGQVPVGT